MKYQKTEAKPVDWVTPKYGCRVDHVWRLIYKHVISDIGVMKRLQAVDKDKSVRAKFRVNMHTTNFSVDRGTSSGIKFAAVEVFKCQDVLEIHKGGKKVTINIEWNEDSNACVLKINGEPQEIWQISKLILSDLFFESD